MGLIESSVDGSTVVDGTTDAGIDVVLVRIEHMHAEQRGVRTVYGVEGVVPYRLDLRQIHYLDAGERLASVECRCAYGGDVRWNDHGRKTGLVEGGCSDRGQSGRQLDAGQFKMIFEQVGPDGIDVRRYGERTRQSRILEE